MSPLLGLAGGLAGIGPIFEFFLVWNLMLLMQITAIVGLTFRSRLLVFISIALALLLASLASLCFYHGTEIVDSPDWEIRDQVNLYRKVGTEWALGIVAFIPVVAVAAFAAAREKPSDMKEFAAVMLCPFLFLSALLILFRYELTAEQMFILIWATGIILSVPAVVRTWMRNCNGKQMKV